MRALLGGLLVCVALAAPAGVARAGAWETIAPEGAGFRVAMPAGAVYDVSGNMTLAGRIVEHRYSVHSPDASFWVTWTTLPHIALWLARRDGVLGNVRKDVLGRDGVRETAWQPVRAGDVEGRELRYRLRESPEAGGPEAELDGRLRCFLRDRTLYVFHGEARTPAGSAQMERLFGSIELLPPA